MLIPIFLYPFSSSLYAHSYSSYIPFYRPSIVTPILPISPFNISLLSLLFFLYPILSFLYPHSYSSFRPFYRPSILTPILPVSRFIVPLFSFLFSYSPVQLNVCPISRSLLGISDLRQWKNFDRWVTNQPPYLCEETCNRGCVSGRWQKTNKQQLRITQETHNFLAVSCLGASQGQGKQLGMCCHTRQRLQGEQELLPLFLIFRQVCLYKTPRQQELLDGKRGYSKNRV